MRTPMITVEHAAAEFYISIINDYFMQNMPQDYLKNLFQLFFLPINATPKGHSAHAVT